MGQYSRSLYVKSVDKISFTTDIIVFSRLYPYYSTPVDGPVHSSARTCSLEWNDRDALLKQGRRIIFITIFLFAILEDEG